MKNLDLNALGVVEMGADQLPNIDGGSAAAEFFGFICGIVGHIVYDMSETYYGGGNAYYCPLR